MAATQEAIDASGQEAIPLELTFQDINVVDLRSDLELLNKIIPETINEENDNRWLNRIRISLLNKHNEFENFDKIYTDKIVSVLDRVRLKPTFSLPWELKEGVPKLRT